ncbi:MAG: xanthine dehydrogenase family protein molybdopterin-binding subunit, partial [Candidatus Eremiobacteraeota bacterium]|nr:xanthine dehydrogenase family protein molybdopterin-binding subunit [Candidatus Eremiobacteraeota bacterium]
MKLVGDPLTRVDGRQKVTGTARYAAETPLAGLAYAVMVESTVPSGTIARIERGAAERAPGVLRVLTYENAPKVEQHKKENTMERNLPLLQDR